MGAEELYEGAPAEPKDANAESEAATVPTAGEQLVDELVKGTSELAQAAEKPAEKAAEAGIEAVAEKPDEAKVAEEVLSDTDPDNPRITNLEARLAEQDRQISGLINTVREQRGTISELRAASKPPEDKPTTVAGMRAKYKLEPDDAWTIQMQEELESNRAEAAKGQRTRAGDDAKAAFLGRAAATEAQTIAKYSKDKVGEDLEYHNVVNIGKGLLTPEDFGAITDSRQANPTEELYKRCIERVPFLKRMAQEAASASAKEPSNKDKQTPKTKQVKEPKPAAIPTAQGGASAAEIEAQTAEAEHDKLCALSDEQQMELIRAETAAAATG